MFHGPTRNRIKVTEILRAPGGEKLSPETANWCAELLMDKPPMDQRPHYIGDRNQPREFPRESAQGIVKSLSKCHSVNQGLIRAQDDLRQETDRRLKRIKLVFGTLNALLATIAAVLALLKFL